jgi:hypothetical protein
LKEKGQKWKQCNVGLSPLFLIMERSEKVLAHALFVFLSPYFLYTAD